MKPAIQDFGALARDLLAELRGKRSRPGFSRFLGYRSNIAQRWESQDCWPTAPRFFAICQRLGLKPRHIAARFLRREPEWLHRVDLTRAAGVAAFLTEIRGRTPIQVVAERAGFNRFSVSRWIKGAANPKLPELLAVIEACTRRGLDFVATIANPARLPAVAAAWQELELLREGAYSRPLSHAVLRALELEGYRSGRGDRMEYLAHRTGISADEVRTAIDYLAATGQVRRTRRGYRPTQRSVVDTGGDPTRARALRLDWARRAIARLEAGAAGDVGYSLFAISRADLGRLRQLQLDYLRQMRAIIAGSERCDCVALYCAQLLDLGTTASSPARTGTARKRRVPD